jgi:hypothetical protein
MVDGILVCEEDRRAKMADRPALRRWSGRVGWQGKYLQLLLNNTRSAVAVAPHGTQKIMAEIAALDAESAEVLGRIRGLL